MPQGMRLTNDSSFARADMVKHINKSSGKLINYTVVHWTGDPSVFLSIMPFIQFVDL